ncbi:Blp family class II bacteriocin [Glaciecola sp. SC05]|uniref:Blp family class II bacteriocin n=1 Tax=Glaciecola sp. SC05 TaxID=1987355 RepID=UPI003526EF3C
MKDINQDELEQVSGGINDWTGGGMAVIALGISGGPATGAFGLAVGGSMMIIGYFKAR